MGKMKCCLWGAAVMCLSITPLLYGEDGDDNPAPLAGKTFKDIEAAFGGEHSRFWDLQSGIYNEPYTSTYKVKEGTTKAWYREASEEVKKAFKQQLDFGFLTWRRIYGWHLHI